MGRYLLRREGGIYYFRRPIPAKLRPYFGGRAQWMRTLGTTDPALARTLRDDESVRTNRLLREATEKLERGEVPEPAASPPKPAMSPEEAERRRKAWDEYEQGYQEFVEEEGRRAAREEWELEEDPVKQRVVEAVENARLRFQEEQRIARELARAERQASRVSIMDLFDAYVAERRPAPSTVIGWRFNLRSLVAHLGHDDAGRVTRADMIAWKDALVVEPVKGKPRAAKTINGSYLAAASRVFGWGVRNQKVASNPAADVKVSAPKRVRLRDPGFTDAEATTILRATLQPFGGKVHGEYALARRWVPWLCAYTGARVNEITQLRREDVAERGGVWTIRITPEAGTTKTQAARIVPLHPHLIEQGFVAAVEERGEGPLFYDPGRQRSDKVGKRNFRRVAGRLAEWVRETGVVDPLVQPNHAWRHRFKTIARRVKMDPEARDVIQGHAPRSEGERYGSWEPGALATEVAKLPRFDVPAEPGSPE